MLVLALVSLCWGSIRVLIQVDDVFIIRVIVTIVVIETNTKPRS